MDNNDTESAVVDGHVHLYDCFEARRFLTAALANLRKAAREAHGEQRKVVPVLLLCETPRENALERLLGLQGADRAEDQPPAETEWRIDRLPKDPASLLATDHEGNTLLVIAGRQIVTSEGLEVLALATPGTVESGRSLRDSIEIINAMDAIAVLPWGVGKWLGRRGKVVREYIEGADENAVFLGDISGRPGFWPRSSIFRVASSRGIRVLPGTDPLPLRSETGRVGDCCFYLDEDLSVSNPSAALKKALRNRDVPVREIVHRESAWRFFYNQIRLRMQAA